MSSNGKISAADWATVVTLYQRGEKNARELADQFGVTRQAIAKGLRERGVEKNSSLAEVYAESDIQAKESRIAKIAEANREVKNYSTWTGWIAQLTMKKLMEAERGGGIATANSSLVVLGNAMKIIEKARMEKWTILDIKEALGEENDLPDLNVGEYTEEELEAIRDGNEAAFIEGLDDDPDDM